MGEEFSRHIETPGVPEAGANVDVTQLLARIEGNAYQVPLTREEEQVIFAYYRGLAVDSEQKRRIEGVLASQYRSWSMRVARRMGLDSKEGIRGLQKAIQNFDPARGVRFTTYSARAMLAIILRERARETGAMHLPYGVYREVSALVKKEARGDLTQEETLKLGELRQFIGRKAEYEDIDTVDVYGDPALYEQEERGADPLKESPAYGIFRSQQEPSIRQAIEDPFETVAQQERHDLLETWIQDLTQRERSILRLRLEGKNREEVASVIGISGERVRQIETRLMRKIFSRVSKEKIPFYYHIFD